MSGHRDQDGRPYFTNCLSRRNPRHRSIQETYTPSGPVRTRILLPLKSVKPLLPFPLLRPSFDLSLTSLSDRTVVVFGRFLLPCPRLSGTFSMLPVSTYPSVGRSDLTQYPTGPEPRPRPPGSPLSPRFLFCYDFRLLPSSSKVLFFVFPSHSSTKPLEPLERPTHTVERQFFGVLNLSGHTEVPPVFRVLWFSRRSSRLRTSGNL